jgi:ankyrin repeat protein
MHPPELPLELLLLIAHHIRDDHGNLRYGDFHSFLQVNRALHACLNRMLWKEAAEHEVGARRVFTHLIRTNNLTCLNFFLELGADVEIHLPAFDITGCGELDRITSDLEPTPLLIAADLDNVPLARLLLETGANVQYSDNDFGGKFSPMHAARSPEMAQLLLDHNADPDLYDDIGRPPLHWYAIRDNIAAARAILQHGAEVNPIGYTTETPLHEAALHNLDIVELLVEHGADVRETDSDLNTPLHHAALAGKIDVVKFLVERWPEGTRETNDFGETPLHMAAFVPQRNIDVVRFLVERWPQGKEALNNDQKTPLSMFMQEWRLNGRLSDKEKEKEEVIALLSGPYSEGNGEN